jgi:tRNA U38,U39,U40 pseudouridine synthase TruA
VRLRLRFSDRTEFRGWSTLPGWRTVQDEIEAVIVMKARLPQSARLTSVGRMDVSVHTRGWVAHVDSCAAHLFERDHVSFCKKRPSAITIHTLRSPLLSPRARSGRDE